MEKIKVAYFGTPEFSAKILSDLIEYYNIVLVVSQPDKEVGRNHELKASAVKKVALEHNIPVITPNKIRVEYEEVLSYEPDIIITCAYGQIIPAELLNYPKYGCINIHASLLPKLRGGAPIHHAIIDGYKETGITIMYMAEHMDDGDIIYQEGFDIEDTDTVGTLHDKLMNLGSKLILKTLPSIIDGTNERIKQDPNEVTFGYNIKREEEKIDFNKTSRDVFNQIRGLYPFPMSYFVIEEEEIKACASRINNIDVNGKIGEITHVYKDGIGIKTKDSEIVITRIKPSGKKEMEVSSYLNSHKDMLGKICNE